MPWLSSLTKEEPMSEFGYKYEDPEIGVFYSRLNPEDLLKTDNTKGKDYARILNESVKKDHQQFLREYNPITDPFMHELRLHIFIRDRHFKKANKSSNPKEKKEFYLIAYKENLILKNYFTSSIKNSVYLWDKAKSENLKGLIDKKKSYKSPVSTNLFTAFSEKAMWISIFALVFLLIIINLILISVERQHKEINL
jgi:hypothetical protein